MSRKIQIRRGTAAQWTTANPILHDGELGFEHDTIKLKIGDGLTAWNSLSYISSGGSVTSVGDLSPLFTTSNPTSTPTFTAIAQNANLFYAGPSTGSAAAPTFRALVAADLPVTSVTAGSYTSANITVDEQGRITSASSGSGGSYTASEGITLTGSNFTLGGSLTSTATITGGQELDFYGNIKLLKNITVSSLFVQQWHDASDGEIMSIGGVGSSNLSTALKINSDISLDVELALVQTSGSPRNYGWYWLVDRTTSTLRLYRRTNNVDVLVQTMGNTTGNIDHVGNLNITGTSAFSDNMTITKNFAGTLIHKIVNTTATGTPQLSFQNNQKTVSMGAYGSSAGGTYKILQDGDFHIFNPTAGNINILNDFASGAFRIACGGSSTSNFIVDSNGTTKHSGNAYFGGVGTTPTAKIHLAAGSATASTAPLKFTSGTNLTTAEAGAFEYNGTNLFFTRAGTTRENVLVAVDNATAPTTTATPAFTSYYGGNTNALGDPNRWISVNILGNVYKIPLYN